MQFAVTFLQGWQESYIAITGPGVLCNYKNTVSGLQSVWNLIIQSTMNVIIDSALQIDGAHWYT